MKKTPRQHANPRMYAALGVMTNDQLQAAYERTWQLLGVLMAPARHHKVSCQHGGFTQCHWISTQVRHARVRWALLDLNQATYEVCKARGYWPRPVHYTPSYLALEVAA